MKTLAIIIGFILLAALCLFFRTGKIEDDLSVRSKAAIQEANLPLPDLEFEGRDAILSGMVDTEAIKDKIHEAVSNVYGVRIVQNNLEMNIERLPVASDDMTDHLQSSLDTLVHNQRIKFSTASTSLTTPSRVILSEVAALIRKHSVNGIEIIGHTDNTGEADHNLILSQKRAETVKKYLIDDGVEAHLLSARGYGSSQPVSDNTSASGRAKNRRVEFKVIKGK